MHRKKLYFILALKHCVKLHYKILESGGGKMNNDMKWLNEPTDIKVEGSAGVTPTDNCVIHRCDNREGDGGVCFRRKCVGKDGRCWVDF